MFRHRAIPIPKRIDRCQICGKRGYIAGVLGVCGECLRREEAVEEIIKQAHRYVRNQFNLPASVPKAKKGMKCYICGNECVIGEGEVGFCGLRRVKNGRMESLSTPEIAPVYTYLDPHVTNCCAAWFCPAATGAGYPKFAVRQGPELGHYNLAVFFYGCNFSCLFCQNWEHKEIQNAPFKRSEELAREALDNEKVTCVCYFGGDPDVHLPYTLSVNKRIIKSKGDRVIRICYEWNGDGNPHLVKKAAEHVFQTGGVIKFDLKAPDDRIYFALTGTKPKYVWENFETIYREFYNERRGVPILTATTLLVPGYIGERDVEEIAKKIAEIDRDIPYSLLVFHPDFAMGDLPVTPSKIAIRAYKKAKEYLNRVHLGNAFLLGIPFSSI